MSVRALTAGSAVGFAAGWNIADVGAVADELSASYGVGLAVVGLFTTVLFLAHMLMQLPAGRLSDRFGATRVCAAGLAVLVVCNALAAVADDPALALAARLAMGVGTALAFIGGSDYVRAAGGSPFAQGLYGGLATAGGGVALAVVPLLVSPLGWRAPWVSAIGVAAVASLLLAAGPAVPASQRAAGERAPLAVLARDPRLLRLAVVFAASFGLSVVVGNWVVTLLEETSGLSSAQAGVLGAATLVLGAVSRPFGGWLMRVHPQRVRHAIVASAVAGSAGTLALATGSPTLALVGACVVGLAAGVPFATCFTGAAALYRTSPATAVGFVNATGAFTVLTLTPLVGVAFAHDAGVAAFVALGLLWALGARCRGRASSRRRLIRFGAAIQRPFSRGSVRRRMLNTPSIGKEPHHDSNVHSGRRLCHLPSRRSARSLRDLRRDPARETGRRAVRRRQHELQSNGSPALSVGRVSGSIRTTMTADGTVRASLHLSGTSDLYDALPADLVVDATTSFVFNATDVALSSGAEVHEFVGNGSLTLTSDGLRLQLSTSSFICAKTAQSPSTTFAFGAAERRIAYGLADQGAGCQ